ncbi:putative ABC transport system permease protein [Pseudomonas fulva]|uniref:ABC transporter permease n=1 Tax=Pseudomonas sp. UBA7456 TaxID=1947339 RepID=UPI00257C82BB|nr:ABC transporter permease [Pseudomonas sp. UBA7456]
MHEPYGPGWQQRLSEAMDNVRLMGRRAWLALLGIGIGCASVVALLNMGHSAAQHARQFYEGLGSELMVAEVQREGAAGPRAEPDLTAMPASVQAGVAISLAAASVRRGGLQQEAMIVGSGAGLARLLRLGVDEGRLLSGHDDKATHVVLGSFLARQLDAKTGDRLQIGGYVYDVVGLLVATGDNPLLPVMLDQAVWMPLAGMRRLMPTPEVSLILALGRDTQSLTLAADHLSAYLQMQLPRHQVLVRLPSQLLAGMTAQSQMLTWLLAGFAGIALLLGGIGVMNVMLMTVAERRREIGIRLALGARAHDIGWSFLLEAVLLSGTGAVGGALIGVLAAWVFALLSGWPSGLALGAVPLGMVSSVTVGVACGVYPALAAARLQPVEALRED